jgi:hypothetical protein
MLGEYAAKNVPDIMEGAIGWKSISGLVAGLVLISGLLFIDWRTLLQQKKFTLKLKIWK